MMCHMARDALHHGRNARMHHCFGDEDGMQWLKRHLVVNSGQFFSNSTGSPPQHYKQLLKKLQSNTRTIYVLGLLLLTKEQLSMLHRSGGRGTC